MPKIDWSHFRVTEEEDYYGGYYNGGGFGFSPSLSLTYKFPFGNELQTKNKE